MVGISLQKLIFFFWEKVDRVFVGITLVESYSEETANIFFSEGHYPPQTTEMQFQTLIPSIVPRMGNGFEPQWSWGKIYEILRTVFKSLSSHSTCLAGNIFYLSGQEHKKIEVNIFDFSKQFWFKYQVNWEISIFLSLTVILLCRQGSFQCDIEFYFLL